MLRKLFTLVKVTTGAGLLGMGGFVGYRKRQIAEIEAERKQEIAKIQAELKALKPQHQKEVDELKKQLEVLEEKFTVKKTLWEERLKRFKEATEEAEKFRQMIPKQLQELESIGQMYWVAVKTLHETREQEVKLEDYCRKVNQALFAGNEVLFSPESVSNKGKFVRILEDVKKYAPATEGQSASEDLLSVLLTSAKKIELDQHSSLPELEARLKTGLSLVNQTQHSIASTTTSGSLSARLFSKAHKALSFNGGASSSAPTSLSPITQAVKGDLLQNREGDELIHSNIPTLPKHLHSGEDVHQALNVIHKFLRDAEGGVYQVKETKTPINAIAEGKDALKYMRSWAKEAESYLYLREHVHALHTYLTALCLQLVLPASTPTPTTSASSNPP